MPTFLDIEPTRNYQKLNKSCDIADVCLIRDIFPSDHFSILHVKGSSVELARESPTSSSQYIQPQQGRPSATSRLPQPTAQAYARQRTWRKPH